MFKIVIKSFFVKVSKRTSPNIFMTFGNFLRLSNSKNGLNLESNNLCTKTFTCGAKTWWQTLAGHEPGQRHPRTEPGHPPTDSMHYMHISFLRGRIYKILETHLNYAGDVHGSYGGTYYQPCKRPPKAVFLQVILIRLFIMPSSKYDFLSGDGY